MKAYNCIIMADSAAKMNMLYQCFDTVKEFAEVVFSSNAEEDPEELYLLYRPDIVVLDIESEYEDKVTIINRFQDLSADVRIIVFANYTQFSFETSIQHIENVYFLPRPVSETMMASCVRQIVAELKAIRERDFSSTALNNLLNDYIPIIRQHYLSMILRRQPSESENVLQKFETLKIDCPGPNYTVIVADILTSDSIENFEAVNFLLRTTIKSTIASKGYQCYIFFDSEFKINCLVGSKEAGAEEELEILLLDVKKHFDKMAPLCFVAGIGTTVSSASNIHMSFRDAELAVSHAVEEDSIVLFKNIGVNRKRELIQDRAIDHIVELYSMGEIEEWEKELAVRMENIKAAGTLGELKSFVIKYMIRAMNHLEKWGVDVMGFSSVPFLLSRLYTAVDIQMVESCEREFTSLLVVAKQGIRTQEDYLIEQAIAFIDENISNPSLDLEMVSSEIGISKSYFCRLFHRITNQNFSIYIRSQRVERAKILLTQSNLKAYEVAESVGFTTPKYFSSVFKAVTGMKPSEYQRKCSAK